MSLLPVFLSTTNKHWTLNSFLSIKIRKLPILNQEMQLSKVSSIYNQDMPFSAVFLVRIRKSHSQQCSQYNNQSMPLSTVLWVLKSGHSPLNSFLSITTRTCHSQQVRSITSRKHYSQLFPKHFNQEFWVSQPWHATQWG